MKHLFENGTDYEYDFQDDSMMNEDGCGWGNCSGTCSGSCTSTGWCLNNIGR